MTALAFNVLLCVLPVACALAILTIGREDLYAYEYSEAGARAIAARVARLNGELIQVDFDRQNQWDNLVGMELNAQDPSAARGFLLSGAGMLPRSSAQMLTRAAQDGADDAALERAAMQLLTPATRQRYEERVALLSGPAAARVETPTIGDQQNFELLAQALLRDSEGDPLQFILTGFSLGLGGEFNDTRARGAAALLIASRRDDFPSGLAEEVRTALNAAMPIEQFRAAAIDGVAPAQAGGYANAARAFRVSVNDERAARVRAVLDEIGAMAEATSVVSASTMLTHMSSLRDLSRMRLVAQAAGDRAAAAAKRLPRDGRLLDAARGQLAFTSDLIAILAVAGATFAGLILILLWKAFQAARRAWLRLNDDDYGGELVDVSNNWSPL